MADYVQIYTKAMRDRSVAETRLQAALLTYNAAVMAGEDTVVIDRHRAEIHALMDVMLDNTSMAFYCTNKMSGL